MFYNRKIAITGHSAGIGQHMYVKLPADYGYSRSNLYDLRIKECREKMYEDILKNNIDIFINNAFPYYTETSFEGTNAQLEILYDVYKLFENDLNKLIINIGSNTTTGIKD